MKKNKIKTKSRPSDVISDLAKKFFPHLGVPHGEELVAELLKVHGLIQES
jgi:hypothetical protein